MEPNDRKPWAGAASAEHWTRREFLKTTGVAVSGSLMNVPGPTDLALGEGELHVEIRDGTSGQIVPAMVCITSLLDHKWRTPPDGRSIPPYTTMPDFYEDRLSWKPGDVGPVRMTNGEYNDNIVRSYVYAGKTSYPFWQEPATYFVAKPFSIVLPQGKWRLAIAHGLEYEPVFEEFEIAPGENKNRSIVLRRWVNMPKRGWYSGDTHIHMVRLKPEHNELIMTWARAEDVHVSNTLRYGDMDKVYCEQMGYGKDSRYQVGDYVLVSGQEDPRMEIHEQGHAIALNIQAPVRDVARYHIYDFVFDAVHAQGGLAGYAHLAWASEFYRNIDRHDVYAIWDATINVPRDKVDFVEILQFRLLGLEDYYDFLNLGYKLTASAGSDLPWGSTIGEVRMFVYTGQPFSADAWFDAMKAGHTFVTNGPMVDLRINGVIPGGDLKVGRNARLRVRARAWASPAIGSPKKLEIVAHGQVIRSTESNDPGQPELKLDFSIPAEMSQWVVARVVSHNDALAHTSPVYILVDGESFRNQRQLPELVDHRINILDFISSQLRDPKYASANRYSATEVDELTAEIDEARTVYKRLLSPGQKS
jgi:hypothetical protein